MFLTDPLFWDTIVIIGLASAIAYEESHRVKKKLEQKIESLENRLDRVEGMIPESWKSRHWGGGSSCPISAMSNLPFYFFSTIAQSAAGFVAVVAVFAVFRLQVNSKNIEQRYMEARYWLRSDMKEGVDSEQRAESQIKERLCELREGTASPQRTKAAIQHLKNIDDAEGISGQLVAMVAWPMKLWAFVFMGALLLMAMAPFLSSCVQAIVVIGTIVAVGYVLLETRDGIQKCLNISSRGSSKIGGSLA